MNYNIPPAPFLGGIQCFAPLPGVLKCVHGVPMNTWCADCGRKIIYRKLKRAKFQHKFKASP